MAGFSGKVATLVSQCKTALQVPATKKWAVRAVGVITVGGVTAGFMVPVFATDLALHPPHHPFNHYGLLNSMDHASMRRGYEVYKNVCAACHSMKFIAFRHLVGVIFHEHEAKALAAEYEYEDGPDEKGKMFRRPGRLSDYFPQPYANDEAARAANNGALPPDLSYIVLARHGGEDYIFKILTGYCDAPAGKNVPEGQYYNPYFSGGNLSMAKALYNEIIEYEDGTPATQSQLAKDVVTFLRWSADPSHDTRHRLFPKVFLGTFIITLIVYFGKKRVWSYVKSRKHMYKNRPPPKDF